MKSKCSFTLKALTSLVLAVVMLFGTVSTSIAATVDTADTGAQADLAETGYSYTFNGGTLYFDAYRTGFTGTKYIYAVAINSDSSWYKKLGQLTNISGTGIYYIYISSSWNLDSNPNFGFAVCSSTQSSTAWVEKRTGDVLYYWPSNYTFNSNTNYLGYGSNTSGGALSNYGGAGSADMSNYSNMINSNANYKYTQYARVYYRTGGSTGSYSQDTVTSSAPYGTLKITGKKWSSGTALASASNSTAPTSAASASVADVAYSSSASVTPTAATGYNLTAVRYNASTTYPTSATSGSSISATSGSASSYTVTSVRSFSAFFDEEVVNVTFQKKLGSANPVDFQTKKSGITTAATYTAPDIAGYEFLGWTTTADSDGDNDLSDETSSVYAATATLNDPDSASVSVNAKTAITLIANYSENTSGIALTAYTNGVASTTGGVIKNAAQTANITSLSGIGIDTKGTAVSVVTAGGTYSFAGWQMSGTNWNHIKYSFDDSTYYTAAAKDTIITGSDEHTTIYIKTDGTAGMTIADAIVKAMFITDNRTVTVGKMLATDGTGYSVAKATAEAGFSPSLSGGGDKSVSSGDTFNPTTTDVAGYKFIGWYTSDSAQTTAALDTVPTHTNLAYGSTTITVDCDTYYYALYKKIYYITVYNSYDEPEEDTFVFRTSPPRVITATNAQGTTTFEYATTADITARGEDQFGNGDEENDLNISHRPTGATKNIKTSGTFYEGNLLQVLAGDEIVMTYRTLSSSDVIRGVFFNNDIRYTTELQNDNLFTGRLYAGYEVVDEETVGAGTDDSWNYTYLPATTLFADAQYYRGDYLDDDTTLITSVISGKTYKGQVDQAAHTVTFTADQDYLNIDVELSEKKRVVFSDTKNTTIHSLNVDNYYSVGESISTGETAATRLAVYAKGNADQKTTITLTNVKLYYYNAQKGWFTDAAGAQLADQTQPVQLTGTDATITKAISTGTSITNNYGSSDSSAYIYFTGTMPNTDVYVDLDVNVVYKMFIGSKIVSDTIANKTYLAQVATIRATYTSPSQNPNYHDAGTSALYNTTSKECTAGSQVTYTIVWGTDTGSNKTWDNYYMFNGWYTGTSAGPDYENGWLGNDVTLRYTPKKNTYVYAVGTRDVFINGSAEIIGKNQDWNAGNSYKNLKMNFDPDYVNPDGNARGRYYWTITDDMLTAASGKLVNGPNDANTSKITYANWSTYESGATVNSFFRLYDTETETYNDFNNGMSLWKSVEKFTNGDVSTNGVDFGKTIPTSNDNNSNWENRAGYGWIAYDAANNRYQGWSSPITIYYYPGKGISVSATPIYPHIYLSNGYKNIDQATPSTVSISVDGTASGNNNSTANSTQGKAYYDGSGWTTLSCEGTVRDIQIKSKNADVKITKTVASTDYIVSYFFVYNIATKEKKTVAAVKESDANTYSATVKMNNDEKMYICPIVEYAKADMTVMVDAEQLNYDEWGQFISCYAWYSDSNTSYAYGAYPGQLMVPYDGGLSWSAKFSSTKPGNTSAKLVGITFANYVDGSNTWLGGSSVMGSVTYGGSGTSGSLRTVTIGDGIIKQYNYIESGTYKEYSRANFKAQTYDYREPIAFYTNNDADEQLITFAMKDGNTNLISWSYNDLTTENIKNHIDATSWPVSFEYLLDQKGNYVDLNGYALSDNPTPSFYICAKGMVTYTSNNMVRQFVGGATFDSTYTSNSVSYSDANGAPSVSMDYAVQWYIYDASGKYITNVLTAAYADKSKSDMNDNGLSASAARTVVAKKLDDLGYATSGRSVAICYDVPRYCYNTPDTGQTNAGIANGGTNFDAYRFTGQWLQQNQYETAKVSVEVGLFYAGDYTMSGSSSTDYGAANVTVNKALLTHKTNGDEVLAGTGVDEKTGLNYGMLTIVEGNKGALTITADDTNFKGWYYYDADGELTLASSEASYTPGVSKDITYYAIYSAKATYKLNYTGREGGTKSYSVSGGDMTAAEIGANNTVSTSRTDFDTSFNGAVITMFKKTFDLSSHSSLNNSTARTLQATLNAPVAEAFTLTYYYPHASNGGSVSSDTTALTAYNTAVTLPDSVVSAVRTNAPSGTTFKGWYLYDGSNAPSSKGELISTVITFNMRIVKNTTIIAVYDDSSFTADSNDWNVYIDDHAITREMTSGSVGTYYNDTIIRVRNKDNVLASIPSDAEAGILIVKSGADTSINTAGRSTAQLTNYANNANLTNGKTARITAAGATVTKLCSKGSDSLLTLYNRADFGVRSDYAGTKGQTYSVYAYIKLADGTCYFSSPASVNASGVMQTGLAGTYN